MRFILLLLILAGCFKCTAQKRLVVIGNAGELGKKAGQFLGAVKNTVTLDSNTIVLYLGNTGDTAILRRAASLVQNTSANAWFIPGYDEWVRGNRPGYRGVVAWQCYIESLGFDRIKVLPKDGCPGPVHIPLNSKTEMLLMDTQWWLHDNDKPGMECNCSHRTRQEVLEDVESAVMGQFGKLVIFVGYHPMSNSGVHSGTFGIKQHIFPFTDSRRLSKVYLPLPLIGSLYPFLRSTITSRQDMNNQQYQVLAETGMGTTPGVHAVLKEHAHTIFIAGQEHSLQLLQENGTYSIVSGAAKGGGRVRHTKRVRYAQKDAGFSVVEIGEDGSARTEFYKVKDGLATKSYATGLYQNAEEAPFHDTATRPMTTNDSVFAMANGEMNEAGKIKRFFNGDNYREEWGATVKMKVFHINKEKGGLKIAAIGGGHESITLHLDDSSGKRWILRPVRKSFDKVVPEGFRHTFVHSIVDDVGSAQDPYGALAVPGLTDPLHIPHAHPQVVFIPNDTALGIFRPVYANTVAQLEERKPALNKNELVATNEMVHDLVDKSNYSLDQKGFLKARLIDFLIADFDRHHSQWTWGTIDTGRRKAFYVVPKDRDQAFYNNDGLIINIARRGPYAFMTNFTPRIKKVVNLAAIGVPLDKFCLNELDKSDWQAALSEFRNALNDTVLRSALMRMPPEIYALKGAKMEQTLSARRDIIARRGLQYYKHLARDVDVPGDNGNNLFKVTDGINGALVEVYGTDNNGQKILRYSRQFDPRVTKEVRLYGLNGNDRFDISSHTRVKFRVIGGRGNDTFNVGGRSRAWLYDRKDERNTILSARHARTLFYHNAPIIKFPVKETVHSKIELPKLAVAYNEDDGILLGGGIGYKTFAFQKKPYASYQVLTGTWAFDTKAYQVKYRGTFNNVVRHYDLVLVGDYANPALYYFFGYGNESKKDPAHPIEYYRARYDFISGDILLRRRFYNDSLVSIAVGPSVYHYWNSNNMIKGRLLEYPSTVGLDSADVFALKAYGGGKLVVTLNNLNSDLLPARGVRWISELTVYEPLNKNSSPFTRLTTKMDMYATLSRKSAVRAAIHLGGGQIFSGNFEYFQAMTLGGDSYLRGFRRNRFAGSAMLYASTELSVRLVTFNAWLLKGDFGVTGFNDVGRVWMRNEKSSQWHDGYGGGLYMTPFNVCFVSLFVGFSHEEQMFYAGLGTRFGIL